MPATRINFRAVQILNFKTMQQYIISAELLSGGFLDIKYPIRSNFKIACKIAESYAHMPNVKQSEVTTVKNNIAKQTPLRTFVNRKNINQLS